MAGSDLERVTDWLTASGEPAVRYRTGTWLMGRAEGHPAVRRDRRQIPQGPIVATLLDLPGPSISPYRKWAGLHWRLVSLADFALPLDAADVRTRLDTAIGRELDWIADPRRLEAIPRIAGLYRADASMEGNAVYAASRFGHAQDDRTRRLVAKLLEWQWPDGGWNCDRRSSGYRSSFHESWATAIGLAAYHDATADGEALAAARRTAELLLDHRLFRTLDGRRQIHSSMAALHWPAYWHYDLLAGLRVLLAVDPRLLADPRAADGLDLLESKALPDGRFATTHDWWRAGRHVTSTTDVHRLGHGPAERGADAARRPGAQGRRALVAKASVRGRPEGFSTRHRRSEVSRSDRLSYGRTVYAQSH